MASHRGVIRVRKGDECHRLRSFAVSNKNQEVVLSSEKDHIHRLRRKAKGLSDLASHGRSCTQFSDTSTLVTEGTGVSSLTGSSTDGERRNSHNRSREMVLPPNYTIYEDELQSRTMQSAYISRPIDVDSMQEYEDEEVLKPRRDSKGRTIHSDYISRPIDVDSLQEYEDEDVFKPHRIDNDDSRSRTTASTYSSRPIDVDSVMEYDPRDYSESRLPEERTQKPPSGNGYYEGESLLEYSSDDESVDFETGIKLNTNSRKGREGPERQCVSVKRLQSSSGAKSQFPVSVDLVGPIHLDSSYLSHQGDDDDDDESNLDISFGDLEFPVIDERDMDRELVGYMQGFEPFVEELLPPRPHPGGWRQSDASTKSSNTRVTFEI